MVFPEEAGDPCSAPLPEDFPPLGSSKLQAYEPQDVSAESTTPSVFEAALLPARSEPHTPHSTPHTPHPTPHTIHPTPHILHPTPHTLHPTPHTLHPNIQTRNPETYTLHPTFQTPNPKPQTPNQQPRAINLHLQFHTVPYTVPEPVVHTVP